MPFPPSLQTATVWDIFLDLRDRGMRGSLLFETSDSLLPRTPGDPTIIGYRVRALVNAITGRFEVELPVSNDPDWTAVTYQVTFELDDATGSYLSPQPEPFTFQLGISHAGELVQLLTLRPGYEPPAQGPLTVEDNGSFFSLSGDGVSDEGDHFTIAGSGVVDHGDHFTIAA